MAWRLLALPVPVKKQPAMGLRSNGRLSWTEALDEKLGRPSHVNVLYDADTNRIGLMAAADGNGLPAQTNHQVAIKALLLASGIWAGLSLPVELRVAELDEEAGIWAISLGAETPQQEQPARGRVAMAEGLARTRRLAEGRRQEAEEDG